MRTRYRYWVGCAWNAPREVLRLPSECTPTPTDFPKYVGCIGPFRTKRGARYMAEHGAGNPHCQDVADAERLAKEVS